MEEVKEIIFGYGSLMSLHGFFRLLREKGNIKQHKLWDLRLIYLPRGVRGFAKPTGAHLAMDIDEFELRGSFVQPTFKPDMGFVGVGLVVSREHFTTICAREGYHRELARILMKKANDLGCSIGEYLFKLAKKVSRDGILDITNVNAYRKLLYRKIGGTSKHYIPHPLVMDDKVAITFIAAGKYGTGKDMFDGLKINQGIQRVFDAYEYYMHYRETNLESFIKYLIECLLSGIYGVSLHDILKPLQEIKDVEFKQKIKESIEEYLHKEAMLFIHKVLNGSVSKFFRKFGSLERNIKASGLSLLGVCLPKEVRELVVKKAPSELDYLEYQGKPVAILSDYYVKISERSYIRIKHRDYDLEIPVYPISKFSEYKARSPTYYDKVMLGKYILLNSVARNKLRVNIDEKIKINLK